MNEQICDECRNRDVPLYAYPCCDCVDGNKYEQDEGSEEDADT